MPTWLSDPPRSLYVTLVLAAVLPLLAAFFLLRDTGEKRGDPRRKTRSKRRLALIGVSLLATLLFAGIYICDTMYESPREQIVRKLREMSEAVHERNVDKLMQHIAKNFRYGAADKARLRLVAERARISGQVDQFIIWDVEVGPIDKDSKEVTVQFRFKVTGPNIPENHFIGISTWERELDGQWRASTVEIHPATSTREVYTVPGLS